VTELRKVGKCLVTGVNGFIGSRLFAIWDQMGLDVVGWSREDVDLSDAKAVQREVSALSPDTIVHLAATPPTQFTDSWVDVAREVSMLSHVAEVMPNRCRLILAGSMAEYGCAGTLAEWDLRKPNTAYGFAKMICSDHALALRTSGKDISVARLFGVFGAGEADTRLIPSVVNRLEQNLPISLSDGKQIRDFIHVDDVSAALLKIAELKVAPAVLNIGTGKGISVRDACEKIADYLAADRALLQFGAVERRGVDEDVLIADTLLLQEHLEYVPAQRFAGNLDFIDKFKTVSSGTQS